MYRARPISWRMRCPDQMRKSWPTSTPSSTMLKLLLLQLYQKHQPSPKVPWPAPRRLHPQPSSLKEALIALGHENPEEWFWRLPCALLAIRTTVKPDIGASPADLVFGEGLAVPGENLPSNPSDDAQLLHQREAALADARLEVARLQPTQTSAHRKPLIHCPLILSLAHMFSSVEVAYIPILQHPT